MSVHIPAILRRLVINRAKGRCEYCLIHESDTFFGCEIEHIISQKHQGITNESNLALACVFCNRYKGSDIGSISQATAQFCRLFNPRADIWTEHFRIDGTRIIGITEIGQVTSTLLNFNDADRLLERKALIEAGRFPPESIRS